MVLRDEVGEGSLGGGLLTGAGWSFLGHFNARLSEATVSVLLNQAGSRQESDWSTCSCTPIGGDVALTLLDICRTSNE